ncbi:hypothetical protein KL910_002922 [Ogataea haglerorum]|nr:hypothetical protein KL910_002922 [Ogataea haglerorum]KAG7790321.1 hypothetical protein KL945_001202 [Ogataea haglerorum]KAG7801989.1 hypothetical protein KL944_003057 [Ogataea haglerorum]
MNNQGFVPNSRPPIGASAGANQITQQDRVQFVNFIVASIAKIQGSNFSLQRTKPVAEEYEKFAFNNSSTKREYVDYLKSKIASINQSRQNVMQKQQQQQQQTQQSQQPQQPQPQMARPTSQPQKIDIQNIPIPPSLLAKLPPLFPQGYNTWAMIMPFFRQKQMSPHDMQLIKEVYTMHTQLIRAKQQQEFSQIHNAMPGPQANQGISAAKQNAPNPQQVLMLQRQQQMKQSMMQQQQPMVAPQQPQQQHQQPQQPQQAQQPSGMRPAITPEQLESYKNQALQVIKNLQASNKLPPNLTPEQENTYVKRYLYHLLNNARQQPKVPVTQNGMPVQSQVVPQSRPQQNIPINKQQIPIQQQQNMMMQMQQNHMKAASQGQFNPMSAQSQPALQTMPQGQPQQLPTNQNQNGRTGQSGQQFGNHMPGQPLAQGQKPAMQPGNTGPRLFTGVQATDDDWRRLKAIYQEVAATPINLKDLTDEISEQEKQQIIKTMKQCQQLVLISETIIIPNFYMMTKSYEGTKKLMYSQLMIKQVLERLKNGGRFYANYDLLTKVQTQITRFLAYVKEQNSKMLKGQQQQHSVPVQNSILQPGMVPPQNRYMMQQQPGMNVSTSASPVMQRVSTPQQQFMQHPSMSMNTGAVPQQFQQLSEQRQMPMMGQSAVTGKIPAHFMPGPPGGMMPSQQPTSAPVVTDAKKQPVRKKPAKPVATSAPTPKNKTIPLTQPGAVPASLGLSSAPSSSAANGALSSEVQSIMKEATEMIAKEESKLHAIDQQRNRRRELAGVDPARYVLAVLADTLNLPEEESKIFEMAKSSSLKSRTLGSNAAQGNKVLTPSAILTTPLPFNVKTPTSFKYYGSAITPAGYKGGHWQGKVNAIVIAGVFREVVSVVPKERRESSRNNLGTGLLSDLSSSVYPTPPDEETQGKRKIEEVETERKKTKVGNGANDQDDLDDLWNFDGW